MLLQPTYFSSFATRHMGGNSSYSPATILVKAFRILPTTICGSTEQANPTISSEPTHNQLDLPTPILPNLTGNAEVKVPQYRAKACEDLTSPAGAVAPRRAKSRHSIPAGIDLTGDGYLTLREVLAVYPISRAGWYAGIKEHVYPASTPLGKRRVGWSRASIRDLIANPPKF
jgi:predicted DNA-binding transcriptional regulator AlpA